jgi:hypothetical protein
LFTRVTTSKTHSVSQTISETSQEEEVEEAISFPARKIEQPVMIIEEKIQPRASVLRGDSKELTEDEDLEIPAFIRRKMKK